MDACKKLHEKCLTDNLSATLGMVMVVVAIFSGPSVVLLVAIVADKCKTEFKDYCTLFVYMYLACYIFVGYFWSIYWAVELQKKSKK